MEKSTIPKGTRDFGPAQMAKRQFIIENIKKVFQKYGFQPLETPAMENLTTLTGKYGEEGDQLLFKDKPQIHRLRVSLILGNCVITVPISGFYGLNRNNL